VIPTTCAHPGCPGASAAWLAYDYESRCAWLDDEPGEMSQWGYQWPLCRRHADRLRVPRGWFCIDRRAAPRHWDGWPGWEEEHKAAPGGGADKADVLRSGGGRHEERPGESGPGEVGGAEGAADGSDGHERGAAPARAEQQVSAIL
ncbi:MAG TPA: DUF3499 family protein, partial [Acidimicrobiales bacterium]|nr:DUF3499 family protein [Acidimicrobiales bacterium]